MSWHHPLTSNGVQNLLGWTEAFEDVALRVSDAELKKIRTLLERWVRLDVRYNYWDLPLATGIMGHGWVLNHTFPDTCDTENPGSLFCSQAILLCLRHCLSDDPAKGRIENRKDLLQVLAHANSRAMSPRALKILLAPYCRRVDRSSINRESLVFRDPDPVYKA